jgi:hypothetical protein
VLASGLVRGGPEVEEDVDGRDFRVIVGPLVLEGCVVGVIEEWMACREFVAESASLKNG